MNNLPDYPGHGSPCNGCGQCCKGKPCPISEKYDLWQYDIENANYTCKALKFRSGQYWCDVVNNPRLYAAKLAKFKRSERLACIGANGICNAKENKND